MIIAIKTIFFHNFNKNIFSDNDDVSIVDNDLFTSLR